MKNSGVYVIAEIGSNFGGDLELAKKYIREFSEAGADAIKFQSWETEKLYGPACGSNAGEDDVVRILRKYELKDEWHEPLMKYCAVHNVDFLSTPFSIEKARLLRDLGVKAIKIASGDLTYTQLLKEVSTFEMPIILSTGMASMEEIQKAIDVLGESRQGFTLLHCVGAYPPDLADANVRCIPTLKSTFECKVGFSDHYPGHATALAAVALGAAVVEKHVTFSRDAGHPDSPFALELDEFREMVSQIRLLETALGSSEKACRESELSGRIGGRRSLYWVRDIGAGERITEADVSPLRPADGDYLPEHLDELVGLSISKAIKAGTPVLYYDIVSD